MEVLAAAAAGAILFSNNSIWKAPPHERTRVTFDYGGGKGDNTQHDTEEDLWWHQYLDQDQWNARSAALDPTLWGQPHGQHLHNVRNRVYISPKYFL